MFLGRESHSRAAALLKLHWPIVDLALIPSIRELSLKLRSCSSERLTKYPFSWRGQSMLLKLCTSLAICPKDNTHSLVLRTVPINSKVFLLRFMIMQEM